MHYHLLDEDHIEILAGDITRGMWKFAIDTISREGEDSVKLSRNIKSLEIRLKRLVGKLDTISELPVSGFLGVALSSVWGPMGGLAGQAVEVVAGKDEFLCVGAQLKDGRKFIAYMRKSVFELWCKSSPDAKKIEKKKKNSWWEDLISAKS